jgi:membrane protease YdiL (CAAX protease family)
VPTPGRWIAGRCSGPALRFAALKLARVRATQRYLFLVIAFGLAWLLDLPIWFSGQGLSSPWALLILLRNFTPLIATLSVIRYVNPVPHVREALGLRRGAPGVPWLCYWVGALLGMTLLNLGSAFVGALFGRFPLDLQLTLARSAADATAEGAALFNQIGVDTYVTIVLSTLPLQALLLALVTLGEELGWRGFLLPHLVDLGERRALILSGAIWGLWHWLWSTREGRSRWTTESFLP